MITTCDLCKRITVTEQYTYPDGHTETLCARCAEGTGFCPLCGEFAAGEVDDFLGRYGLCYQCWYDAYVDEDINNDC